MHIIKIGFTYKTAPIELREKLTFPEEVIKAAMLKLNTQKSIMENVIISTCNRTEIYVVADQLHTGRHYVKQFIADWFDLEKEDFIPYLQITENEAAVEHLLKVTVGLNSMVLGETQILGQVRDAFLLAQEIKVTGTIFNELFKRAITFAKKAHHDTAIGEQAVSISYAAVELAKKIFGQIDDKHVVIYGAGEMGELAVENLHGAGVGKITVVNRTLARAEALAEKFSASVEGAENLLNVLASADILISSTGSSSAVLTKSQLKPIQRSRKGTPLFIVDIALPRDVDPAIDELDNVFLYDIDDLQHVVDDNLQARKEAATLIEIELEKEIVEFNDWVAMLGVVPVITALREKASRIQSETLTSIFRKIPELTEREQRVLNKHTKSIINQILKEPLKQVKELASSKTSTKDLELFVSIFGLEDEVASSQQKQQEEIQKTKTKQEHVGVEIYG